MREGLKSYLAEHSPLVILYSGGVDSTLLCALALEARARAVALTVDTGLLGEGELEEARRTARTLGIEHVVKDVDVLSSPVAQNPRSRCYHCKLAIIRTARALYPTWSIVEGTNVSDLSQPRPGIRALREHGVLSPYLEVGITKDEIRRMAEDMGLRCASRPSSACLASRIPYGEPITHEKIERIRRAEGELHRMGFLQLRVRAHGGVARIEVPVEDLTRALEQRERITAALRRLGFSYITLDLEGFRSGSMDI